MVNAGEGERTAPRRLTHLDDSGAAHMVDVGAKPVTSREARARAVVEMTPSTATLLLADDLPKGDAVAVARIAGIMAAKQTPSLVPLCHPVALSSVTVDLAIDTATGHVTITATAATADRTGVEMEAMTAATVAALTLYDMVKGVERGVTVGPVVLLEKSGGKEDWAR